VGGGHRDRHMTCISKGGAKGLRTVVATRAKGERRGRQIGRNEREGWSSAGTVEEGESGGEERRERTEVPADGGLQVLVEPPLVGLARWGLMIVHSKQVQHMFSLDCGGPVMV
jgi:hypothetical protein